MERRASPVDLFFFSNQLIGLWKLNMEVQEISDTEYQCRGFEHVRQHFLTKQKPKRL